MALAREAEDLGYDTVFAGEVAGPEVFGLLGAIAATTSRVRLSSGVTSIFLRPPALAAMGFAGLDSLAPGRVVAGLGVGSHAVVGDWMGLSFEAPRARLEEWLVVFRAALSGAPTDFQGKRLRSRGFRLTTPPPGPIPVLVGTLRPAMLEVAAAIADGVILASCPVDEAPGRVAAVAAGAAAVGKPREAVEVASWLQCCIEDAPGEGLERMRRIVLQYAVLPTHREAFRGSFPAIEEATARWRAGDRRGALGLVGDDVVQRLTPAGSPALVAERLAALHQAGIDLPVLFPNTPRMGDIETPRRAIREVARELGL